jgi:uncharacterized protein (UPF0548 family)
VRADLRRRLAALRDVPLNFDPQGEHRPEDGWHVDDLCQPLPPEAPGPPEPGGSWETARRLLRDYGLADPAIVRGHYDPEAPLEQRVMLLELRWHGLRLYAGVRVGGVTDETRDVDGRPVRVWGWDYRTLRGHVEMGRLDYEVWKWLDTGEVQFRIHAYSKPARDVGPILRLGFRIVGRRAQLRFYRHACARMADLTARAGSRSGSRPGPPSARTRG